MAAEFQCGFYGKVPALGDFVMRRLPRPFVAEWDQWLQSSLAASREQLGSTWLDVYLTSPIWRFGLSPGICGERAWVGVLMPSVDKVGRYFPMTLAYPLADEVSVAHLFGTQDATWFEGLEQLALSCLEDDFSLETFEERLKTHPAPGVPPVSQSVAISDNRNSGSRFACCIGMNTLEQAPEAFIALNAGLMSRFIPLHSWWCTSGSDRIGASLLVCEGLPPIDAFVALLTGYWEQRGWSMQRTAARSETPEGARSDGQAVEAAGDGDQASGRDRDFPDLLADTRPRMYLPKWVWRSWGSSVVGKKRLLNEDAMIERSEAGLWAVADGMGGHLAGDVASKAIVDALAEVPVACTLEDFALAVEQCLQDVNAELRSLAGNEADSGQIIGSTVVALLAQGSRCIFQWAGDSRLYRYRGGRLEQLTRDHTLFEDLSSHGLLGPDQLEESGRCDIITRAVGASSALELSQGDCEARSGDLFLLCSDGLDKELSREEIEAILQRESEEDIVKVLVENAEERGARDNVTVVLVKAVSDGPETAASA